MNDAKQLCLIWLEIIVLLGIMALVQQLDARDVARAPTHAGRSA